MKETTQEEMNKSKFVIKLKSSKREFFESNSPTPLPQI